MLSPTNEKTSYEQLLPSTSTSTLRSGERERMVWFKSVADQQFINSSNGFAWTKSLFFELNV